MSVPVIIDTDPGIDDAIALLLAASWRKCDVRAVTTTYGNTTIDIATRNARLVLARGGSNAPVHAGADRPLTRDLVTANETHGASGLGDLDTPPAPRVEPSRRAICDALRAQPGPVTLITLGPLTNLALALREDAALVRAKVAKHVFMGGNVEAKGNTGPFSEFNVWCDPEAAAEVFEARLDSEMVGLDVTRQLVMPGHAVKKLAEHPDEDARWLGRLLGFYVRFHHEYEGLHGAVINDPLAIALALEPGWGAGDRMPVRVELTDTPERGRTARGQAGDPMILAYRRFDLRAVHELLLEHVFGRWLTHADFTP